MMKVEFDRMRKDMQEMVKSEPAQEEEESE